jgi:segregation and condensation protein B
VGGGYRLRTDPENAPWVRTLTQRRPVRLSRAALETVAIVAYRQPVTRADVDEIRGVESSVVLRSLLEKELLRIAGRKEEPGRPMLYATTRRFLEVFGLSSLSDLPSIQEFKSLAVGEQPGLFPGESALDETEPAADAPAEGTEPGETE